MKNCQSKKIILKKILKDLVVNPKVKNNKKEKLKLLAILDMVEMINEAKVKVAKEVAVKNQNHIQVLEKVINEVKDEVHLLVQEEVDVEEVLIQVNEEEVERDL